MIGMHTMVPQVGGQNYMRELISVYSGRDIKSAWTWASDKYTLKYTEDDCYATNNNNKYDIQKSNRHFHCFVLCCSFWEILVAKS